MHPTTTQCPKANKRFPHISLLILLLVTAILSLSCQESTQNRATQNGNEQEGNKAVASPTPRPVDPEPIVVTGGSLDLKLRPSGFGANGNDSVFTCLNCWFGDSITFREKDENGEWKNLVDSDGNRVRCDIPSPYDSIVRIDANGNKPDIVITAADRNVTVTLDPDEYRIKDGDRLHRYNGQDTHHIKDVWVKARPGAAEIRCEKLHPKVEVTIPVYQR